jgi:F-type H+-transporting ATPase subunit b
MIEKFGIEPKYIVMQVVSFPDRSGVLYKFGIKPTIATMEERNQKIGAGLKPRRGDAGQARRRPAGERPARQEAQLEASRSSRRPARPPRSSSTSRPRKPPRRPTNFS